MDTTRPSLLLRIRDPQDADSWETFHAIYRPLLIRFARSQGLAADAAEDVCQQVLEVVHTQIQDFDYDRKLGRFKAWLRQLVLNRTRPIQRREVLHRDRQIQVEAHASTRGTAFPSPEESFERIWLEEHLWHVLAEIAPTVEARTMELFRGLIFEQRSVATLSEQYGVSEANVHTIKWRMMKRIRARMVELCGEEEVFLDD